MKSIVLNKLFVEIVNEKIKDKRNLVNTISDILPLEKESVYRRLRNEVPFTFAEIVTLAETLSISVDNIIGLAENRNIYNYQMVDYFYPKHFDYEKMENYLALLQYIVKEPFSEFAELTNVLPQSLYLKYNAITRFFLFKWRYHCHFRIDSQKKFQDVEIPSRIEEMKSKYIEESRCINETILIWDRNIIKDIVDDIHRFVYLSYINSEDLKLLKDEFLYLLNDIEEISFKGCYPKTDKKVSIYISDLSVGTNYGYMESSTYKISLMKVYSFNAISSLKENSLNAMKNWIDSYKSFSTLISASGGKERFEFIQNQKNILNNL